MAYFKTGLLMVLMTCIVGFLGTLLAGFEGLIFALLFAGLMNIFAWYKSDSMVLKMYGAKQVSESNQLSKIVKSLCRKANMPMPKVFIIENPQPNAFATGRNPDNSSVAATTGLLERLSQEEVTAVMAHELAHIKNKDILIGSIAATMAATIAFLANMAQWSAIFGSRDRNNNIFSLLIIAMITPIIAGIIQMSISRSREFQADKTGAIFAKDTKGLSSALEKLEKRSKIVPMKMGNNTTSHLFIINPFSRELLASHPSTKARIQRLNKLKLK